MKHLLLTSLLLLVSLIGTTASAQSIWSRAHLEEVRQHIDQPYYAAVYAELIQQADALLDCTPLSVMMKKEPPVSGDMHDYMSIARYTWPNPSTPDGLPYINRDGVSNPELKLYDREPLGTTAQRVITLSLAYYFTRDERYAQKATELIRVWFFNKDTYMKPHLTYAQVVKGHNGNRGRCIGVIDTYSFVDMLEAVPLLEESRAFTAKDSRQLKQWFGQLLHWITTDPEGRKEGEQANNHSIAFDAQVISFALYSGQVDLATEVIRAFPEKRLFPQIEADGRQPHELRRTLAFHYSWYNITHMVDIFLMAQKLGISIDHATEADGSSFYRAMDFMRQYMGKTLADWQPYQQISGWDEAQQHMCQEYYRVATLLDTTRTDYLAIWQQHRRLDLHDRFNLIYVRPTLTDQAYAAAEPQLRHAIACARQAKADPTNMQQGRVIPRTIRDGQLSMVGCRDWCSGFFPGSLWQMYDYTHDNYWREQAVSWTWPIEDLKYHGGTHDLGFMANCSFGHGLTSTGEQSFRDVILQASRTLITRFSPTIGCIRSWDHNRDKWLYPVIIDNMMNLEMLFRATQLTGDSTFWHIAVRHADVTLANHFRPDASSYHVVDYDPVTGQARKHQTHQGYSDDSFWSRGQGWGLYGYTMCYRFTHDARYLQQAQRIADFWLSLPNMPADGVPYWDMKAPEVVGLTTGHDRADVPRDASAAALIASALYELATYLPEQHDRYRAAADHILESLFTAYRAPQGEAYGFLLLHSTGHKPAGSEVDVPLNYADYYYLEALTRRETMK